MPTKITKNISLTPHLDQYIEKKVQSGRYHSASEVVREGLRMMEERDATRRAVEVGWQESEREATRNGEAVMKRLRGKLVRKLGGAKRGARTRA